MRISDSPKPRVVTAGLPTLIPLGFKGGSRHIRVNSLNPGLIETEGTSGILGGELYDAALKTTPLGRIGQPQDIGRIAVFLASEDSYWVNGQTIFAAGGQTQ